MEPSHAPAMRLRVGVDTIAVARVLESIEAFGARYLRRVFTAGEIAYAASASGPEQTAERLAARFAAKEATIKALALVDRAVDWRAIEITRDEGGVPALALHGGVREAARERFVEELSVSLSHDDGRAIAVVIAVARVPTPTPNPTET